MKAYQARDIYDNVGVLVAVFAENASKAKVAALTTDWLEDSDFTSIRVKRLPKLDNLYKGWNEASLDDPAVREILVKEYGWRCIDMDYSECEICAARDYCDEYQDYIEEREFELRGYE